MTGKRLATSYPVVKDEFETLDLVLSGSSIARYGDGEFNLVRGGNCVSQKHEPLIQLELRRILQVPRKQLVVGIPRLDPRSPKINNWTRCCSAYGPYLNPKAEYGSAFITRPDSAPWIATDDFFNKVESLWRGKDITMVYGSNRSLSSSMQPMVSAKSIAVVPTDYAHTYHRIDEIEQAIVKAGNHVVLLMCGPTATCLAHRLAGNFHAIDLGHIGMWWMAHRNPKLTAQLLYMK